MAEWSTLGALGEPTDVIIAPPRNPARAPQGVEDAVYGMTVKPLSDIGMGVGSVVEGQGWNSPEASTGFLAAMGLLTPMKVGPLRPGIKAYHGSPHDFDRFDISKIGTGEGAQAYGHGLYFAENPKTAQSYRNDPSMLMNALPENLTPAQLRVAQRYYDNKGNLSQAVADLENRIANSRMYGDSPQSLAELREELKLINGGWSPPPGKMYEVSINAKPEQFLDWDRPLAQQNQGVMGSLDTMLKRSDRMPSELINSSPGVEARMRDAGIPGIRYLDQGSRTHAADIAQAESRVQRAQERLKTGAGDPANLERQLSEFQSQLDALRKGPTSNYVLFRDDIIDILRKYGIMAPASGVALDQATQRQ
jgi:hypothetical protein